MKSYYTGLMLLIASPLVLQFASLAVIEEDNGTLSFDWFLQN
jgi:hypothetical protein